MATVPRFNLWTLSWTADRLPHGFAGWWDAPIFWPQPGTFAFSEPQPLTGVAFALARPFAGSAGSYAAVLIATVTLNGLAGAALARRLGADRVPAFLAGVLAQALPFTMDQLGVLQLLAVWPLLAATAALARLGRAPAAAPRARLRPGAGRRGGDVRLLRGAVRGLRGGWRSQCWPTGSWRSDWLVAPGASR